MMLRTWSLILLVTAAFTGCANIPTPAERHALADLLAHEYGWKASVIPAGEFDLVSYAPVLWEKSENLTVYIEGDGFAWITSSQPSADPTPRDPLALRLALTQPTGAAVYLARPCQYIDASRNGCSQRYWTQARFASEVVDATDKAVDLLKTRFGAQRLTLVGYSGGGAVATLLAERRTDIVRLITVAGNLDHRAWTNHHRVSPLTGSLNAADQSGHLNGVTQVHLVGGQDKVIPLELGRSWPREFIGDRGLNLHVMSDFDHHCCWVDDWAKLWFEFGTK
jgi:dienelactone hydrolase